MLKKYIGDRAFYARVCAVVIPIIIQNGITNFVSLLDNIMVGQVGTLPMSGVSIVNSLMFVFNLCVFGAGSGAGIFTAQFHGSGDVEGVRFTFRFKMMICTLISAAGTFLFLTGERQLIGMFLTGEGDPADAAFALAYGSEYLRWMLLGLLPFAITNAYASTLRETGETVVPMVGGITAVFVNLIGNYVLIFGHFGLPAMGVAGAAIATVVSRFVELAIVAGWTHLHTGRNPFIVGAYRSFRIPGRLLTNIIVKGMPLLANEFLWSSGIAIMSQCYSTCGLDVVPALNIANTLTNLTSVVYMALGVSVGILMGQLLGSGAPAEQVMDENRKMVALAVVSGVVFCLILIAVSGAFPLLYSTEPSVRRLATWLMVISACMMPVHSYANCAYFTLRSGGRTYLTFAFDSGFMWAVSVPLGYVLSRYTGLPILPLYAICQSADVLKCFVGHYFLKQGSWVRNLT